MKKYIATFTKVIEEKVNIDAINPESAKDMAEQIAYRNGYKVKDIYETVDMNKFLCKEQGAAK